MWLLKSNKYKALPNHGFPEAKILFILEYIDQGERSHGVCVLNLNHSRNVFECTNLWYV